MKSAIVIVGIVCVVFGFILGARFVSAPSAAGLIGAIPTSVNENRIESGFVNSSSSVTSTARLVIDLNTSRQSAEICNDGTQPVYLVYKSTSTGIYASTGYRLASAACQQVAPYIGQVWAISATTTAQTLTIQEK